MKRHQHLKNSNKLNAATTILVAMLLLLGANLQAQIRIMPLGNSITADNNIDQTPPPDEKVAYRKFLWDLLQTNGYTVDFVGSQQGGSSFAGFDPDHEAYPGIGISDLSANVYGYLTNNPADYILLHIGTNDRGTLTVAEMTTALEALLDEIDRYENDNATSIMVFLAQIIGDTGPDQSFTTNYNNAMYTMAQQRAINGDKIVMVDMQNDAGLVYTLTADGGDFYDALHPDDAGYEKMGQLWFNTIQPYLDGATYTPPPGANASCPPEIVHYWKFDEEMGAPYADELATSPGQNGTFGGMTYPPGRGEGISGFGLQFTVDQNTGSAQGVEIPGTGSGFNWANDQSFSIEYWMRTNTVNTNNKVQVGRVSQLPSGDQWWIGIFNNGKIHFELDAVGAGERAILDVPISSTMNLRDDAWHHVVGIYNAGANLMLMYVDGVLINSLDVTGIFTGGFDYGDAPLTVGYHKFGTAVSDFGYEGLLDELAIHNKALSPEEILTHYNNGNGQDYCTGESNTKPVLTSDDYVVVNEGDAINYTPTADDADGDPVTISNSSRPNWMTWDGSNLTGSTAGIAPGEYDAQFTLDDGKGFRNITVTFRVNDIPAFSSTPQLTITEGEAYNYTPTGVDSDVDAGFDFLAFTATVTPVWLNFDGATPILSGTAPALLPNDPNEYDVTIELTDTYDTVSQNFTIKVITSNKAPVFTSTPVTLAKQGQDYEYTVEATDADSDPLVYSIPTNITLPKWLSFDPNTGILSSNNGRPNNGDVGEYNISIQVDDQQAQENSVVIQSFTLTVSNTNDAPVITSTPATEATEDVNYSYTLTATDIDEGDVLTYEGITVPAGWLTFDANTQILSGKPGDAEAGNDYNVTLRVSDGTVDVDQTFTITVANVNDTPIFTSDPVLNATQDAEYAYTMTATDADGDVLTYSLVSESTWLSVTGNVLSGTPTNDDVGTKNVIVRVSDGLEVDEQVFTITIANENDAPTFTSAPLLTATQGVLYSYAFTAEDIDGDALTFTAPTLPVWLNFDAANGLLSAIPGNANVGIHNVVLEVTDGGLKDTQAFQITVGNTNDAPTFTSTPITGATEDALYEYQLAAQDIDGNDLTFTAVTKPAWLTLSAAGLLSGTPLNAQVGAHQVIVRVSDGTLTDEQEFIVTVANTNDAPVFTTIADTTAQQGMLYSYTVQVNDVDEGDVLTLSAPAIPDWLNFDPITGELSGTPTNAEVGIDQDVIIEVTDDQVITQQVFTIKVSDTNDAPVFTSTPVTAATEDLPYEYQLEANDIDGNALTFSAVTKPAWLTLTPEGLLSGTPLNAQVGNHDVVLHVSDGLLIDEQVFTITVENTNDAPVITSTEITEVDEEALYSYTLTAEDADADAELSLTAIEIPDWLTFNDATGVLSGTPDDAEVGEHAVTLSVTDGIAAPVEQVFTITVTAVNDEPIITSVPIESVVKEELYSYTFTAEDVDNVNLTLTALIPNWLTFDASTGELSGTPLVGQVGEYVITLRASDGELTATQSFVLTVADNNNAPTDIELSSNTIEEASAIGTFIGVFNTADLDENDVHTYSLDPAILDNEFFEVSGDSLFSIAENLDFETKPLYNIRVVSEDGRDGSITKNFQIEVIDQNEAPVDIALDNTTIEENKAIGTAVGNLSATDENQGDVLTFSLPEGASNNNLFSISGNTLASKATFNFEGQNAYQITVRVEDGNGGAYEETFDISVSDKNDAPNALVLDNNSVAEDAENNTLIGTFTASDEDANDSYTLEFTGNATDNNLFTIDGRELRLNTALDYEMEDAYNISVKAIDAQGGSFSKQFTILVIDVKDTYTISGLVTDESKNPAAGVDLVLYRKNAEADFTEIVTVMPADNGEYSFEEIPIGEYSIAAVPSGVDFVTTYFGNALTLAQASTFEVADADVALDDIEMIPLPAATSGTAIITGTVGIDGGRGLLEDVNIYLVDRTTGELVAFDVSDANGAFEFENIQKGGYQLLVDYAGIPMETFSSSINVKFDEEELRITITINDAFIVASTEQITGIEDGLEISGIDVYPNPAHNDLKISIENELSGTYEIRMFNQTGQLINREVAEKTSFTLDHTLDVSSLPSGVYIIHIIKDHQMSVKKVLKR